MTDRVVRIVIAGDAAGGVRALKTTSAAAKETTVALDRTSASSSKFAATMTKLGKRAVLGGLTAVGIAGFEGVKGIVALQKQMEMLHTQAGASQQEVASQTKNVLGLAGSVGTGPQQLAEALYHVESAGFRGATALKLLKTSAEAAKISGANLTDTTTALTASVFSGIKGAQNYAQAMGLLNATVGAGDMKMQDLNEAFAGPMLATVKGYGLSLKDVGAALATLGDLNIRGADAATQLRMAVQYMAKPAATAGPLLAQLGVNTRSFADAMAKGGLLPALQLLHQRLDAAGVKGSQAALVISDLFSKKGAAGITIFENTLTKLESKYPVVTAGTKRLGSDWAATQKTLAFQFDQIEAGLQSLVDKLGQALIPELSNVLGWMLKNKRTMKDLGLAILAATGIYVAFRTALIIGKGVEAAVAFATGGVADSFWALNAAMDANPIGLTILALAALAVGFAYAYDKSETFRKGVTDAFIAFKGLLVGPLFLINELILGLNLVIKGVDLLIKGYDALPAFLRPTGKIAPLGTVGLIGGNVLGTGLLFPAGSPGGAASQGGQNALSASKTQAPGTNIATAVIHTHVHLDSRQIAESKTRHDLKIAARR